MCGDLEGPVKAGPWQVRLVYSSTWMSRSAHMSFKTFGQTVTLTSPKCAFLSRYM